MRLAADANVLLSAVLGGRAKLVLDHPQITEILTAAVTLAEVEEYAAELARRKKLSLDVVLMAVATLPVKVVDSSAYEDNVAEARRRIGRRDPDDVDILALAIHFRIQVWSNDNDFTGVGVEWFTTARLLAKLNQ
ncbi:MAG TPA: PIN domain-containing protein [Bryobacteraceae bacterium]|nr:PIN domain-containing protein [Bryobacteraceae bacterium]